VLSASNQSCTGADRAIIVKDAETAAGAARTSTASIAALVESAAQGDQQAWRELVLRFGGMIASVGHRYGLSAAAIGELQQTTWLHLVEKLHRIEQPERVGGWLATAASRTSLQLSKRASRYTTGADQMLANLPDDHTFEDHALPAGDESKGLFRG
jgi:DNA-directed RNA polymerase specialized sigma24 family protein